MRNVTVPAEGVATQAIGDTHLRSVRAFTGDDIRAHDGAIGRVAAFILDDRDRALRWMVVAIGNWLTGGRVVLVAPGWVSAVRWEQRQVAVDLDRATIERSPVYDPAMPINRAYDAQLYDYSGRPTYWSCTARSSHTPPCASPPPPGQG